MAKRSYELFTDEYHLLPLRDLSELVVFGRTEDTSNDRTFSLYDPNSKKCAWIRLP